MLVLVCFDWLYSFNKKMIFTSFLNLHDSFSKHGTLIYVSGLFWLRCIAFAIGAFIVSLTTKDVWSFFKVTHDRVKNKSEKH